METSSATSRAPNPACPFESGVRADKINFPDVLEVLPLRDAASDGETDAARRAGDGEEEDNARFALESLDVEIDARATSRTAPWRWWPPRPRTSTSRSTRAERTTPWKTMPRTPRPRTNSAAMRLAAAAAVEAEEIRCQKYFDEGSGARLRDAIPRCARRCGPPIARGTR